MWELLYETFWDRLEHFCFNLCRDEARAEDCLLYTSDAADD